MTTEEIGKKIREYRKRAGLTQFQVEQECGFNFGVMSRYENGQMNPNKETIIAMKDVLKMGFYETAELLGLQRKTGNTFYDLNNE